MKKTEAIVQGTHSDLDGLQVVCGDSQSRDGVRPVYLTQEDGVTEEIHGLWIEDRFIIPIDHNITETSTPGKHIRTFSNRLDEFEITLVEYQDRLQVSVVEFNDEFGNELAYSEYHPIKHFGSIKLMMDECRISSDVEDFIEEILKL